MHVNLAGKKQIKIKHSRVKSNLVSAMTKVWVESEYYLNLESEDKIRYKEKLNLSNKELLPDPNVLDFGRKEEVDYLSDLCFADILNYLINTPGDYPKKNFKTYKLLGMSMMYYITRFHQIP